MCQINMAITIVYSELKPYKSESQGKMAMVSHWAISIRIVCALSIKSGVMNVRSLEVAYVCRIVRY